MPGMVQRAGGLGEGVPPKSLSLKQFNALDLCCFGGEGGAEFWLALFSSFSYFSPVPPKVPISCT